MVAIRRVEMGKTHEVSNLRLCGWPLKVKCDDSWRGCGGEGKGSGGGEGGGKEGFD